MTILLNRCRRLPSLAVAIAVCAPGAALAQPGIERFGTRDQTLPQPTYRQPAPDAFAPPPIEALPNAPGRAATTERFHIRAVEMSGNTIFSNEQLADLLAPVVNQDVTAADLLEIRDAITRRYIDAGYLNSGAVMPDQDVSDGVLEIQIVEGRLADTQVEGLKRLRRTYVTARVDADGVLNREDLQASFERIASDPNIASVNARLGPGARPGEAILTLNVQEVEGWTGEAEAATSRSPSVGGERAALRAVLRNAFGWGDRAAIELGASEGLIDGSFALSSPINARDSAIVLEANASDADVVEEPLNELDIVSKSYSIRLSATHPLMRANGASLTAGLGVSYAYAQTDLDGMPFSFSPGTVNGETNLTVARATLDFIKQAPRQALAVRTTLSYGLEKLDQSPDASDKLEENFWSLAAQAQFVRATTEGGEQLLARAELQVASHSLFALEQFSFGGLDSVRGYRKNQALTDNGVVASLEYRAPLRDLGLGIRGTGEPHWIGALFIDGGYGWNTDLPDPALRELASVGVSLSWHPNERFSANLFAAARLEEVDDPVDKSIQDYGVGFRLISRLW